jgi:hypothetical protein
LAAGRWFSPGTPVSSTNKTDRHDISEILLKVAPNTIKPTNKQHCKHYTFVYTSTLIIKDSETDFNIQLHYG